MDNRPFHKLPVEIRFDDRLIILECKRRLDSLNQDSTQQERADFAQFILDAKTALQTI